MGFFSILNSTISSVSTEKETPETPRKRHGLKNFDADMERLRNYDPAAELAKAEANHAGGNTVEQSQKYQKMKPR